MPVPTSHANSHKNQEVLGVAPKTLEKPLLHEASFHSNLMLFMAMLKGL